MQTKTFKKPSCIVDFNNEAEIDEALVEWKKCFEHWKTMSFEDFINKTSKFKNNLWANV